MILTPTIDVVSIDTCPDSVPLFARWLNRQWGQARGRTMPESEAILRGFVNNERLPLALIALYGAGPAGIVFLRDHDLDARTDLEPWLSSLFVVPDYRRRGVGAALVRACVARAAEFGIRKLFIYTPDQERFFAKLGWQAIGQAADLGKTVTIMEKPLGDVA